LHFGSDQVFWQCPSLTACEGAPRGLIEDARNHGTSISFRLGQLPPGTEITLALPPLSGYRHGELNWRQALHQGQLDIALEPSDPEGFRRYNMWKDIAAHYTMCNLTYPTDKLAALSSVASIFIQSFGGYYIAGLWASESVRVPWVIDQLAWKVGGKNNKPPRRYSEFCGPSWSWISVDGAVEIISSPFRLSEHSFYAPDKEMPWFGIDRVDSGVAIMQAVFP
jgi:hypothetical protein